MAVENGLDGNTKRGEESAKKSSNANGFLQVNEEEVQEDKKTKTAGFHKLFSFADSIDVLWMIRGTIGAIANGLCMPIMTILFGQLTDAFGNNQYNKDIVHVVSKVSLKFIYLAMGAAGAAFLRKGGLLDGHRGETEAARIRSLYLETILRQDVAFFDKETNTGEIVGRMSGDTVLIEDAMGEKLVSTFLGGIVIAFIRGWLLTLVLASSIPLLVVSGAVASFTGEKQVISNYSKCLEKSNRSGVHEGWAAGLGLGMLCFGYMVRCKVDIGKGLHWWCGIAVLTGSMSLGQASPCISAFAAGQAAAHPTRLSELILDGFDLKVPSGTTAALVGQSGSGKSTVITLIEGFYDPQAGEVLIDGINLKDFQQKWIREKIGLVSQEPVLFSCSIVDNILYGKENASMGEIRAVVELANAATFIDKLPQIAKDAIGSIRTVTSFCAQVKVMELYKKICEGPVKTGIKQGLINGIGFALSFFLMFCVYATSFYAGAQLVVDGKAT
ncbi:ATP-binding cassette containing protein, partial [Parasponia andersonii]